MSVIERKTRHQRTFERDSGGSKPYSFVATNSCGTRYEKVNDKEEGRLKFTEWLNKAKEIYTDVIGTIHRHLDSICNYFINRTTSGVMEGINNRLKLIKRQAYGFVNFDNMRSRFLACFS